MLKTEKEELRILEIGLSTGLNAFLTVIQTQGNNQKIHFTSLELFRIKKEIYENLNTSIQRKR